MRGRGRTAQGNAARTRAEPSRSLARGFCATSLRAIPNYTGYIHITHDGRGYYRLNDNSDYLFVNGLGDFSYSEGVYIEGGRNVVVIGGRITATGLERGHGVGLSLKGMSAGAHHYIEGVRIRPQYDGTKPLRRLHDGIATRGAVRARSRFRTVSWGRWRSRRGSPRRRAMRTCCRCRQARGRASFAFNRLTGMTDYTGVMESEILVRKQNWHEVNLRGVDIDPANRRGRPSTPTTRRRWRA